MLNCYWQILSTYFTKFRAWVYRAILFCFALITLAYGQRQPIGLAELFIILYFLATLLHLKRQLAVPQATLIPHYRPCHMIVAGFLLLPVPILTPICASIGFHIPVLPIMGLTLAFFALVGWAAYLQFLPLTIVAVALGAVPLNDTASKIAASLLMQPPIGMVPSLSIGGLIGFGFLALRMMHLTEEMPEYARNNPLFGGEKGTSANGFRISSKPDYTSHWQQFVSAPSERLINRLAFNAHPSVTQRMNRWRVVGNNAHAMRILGFIIAIPSVVLTFFLMKNVSLVLPLLWILPAPLIIGIAYRRCQLFGYQSLYPLSRRSFFTEQAFVLACEWAQVWLSMAFTTVVATAILSPDALSLLFLNLAISASGQIFLFAIIAWLLRFASVRLLTIPLMPIAFMVFPMEKVFARSIGIHAFLIAVLSLLFLSALILYDAYRRWLITDLA